MTDKEREKRRGRTLDPDLKTSYVELCQGKTRYLRLIEREREREYLSICLDIDIDIEIEKDYLHLSMSIYLDIEIER